MLSFDDKKLTLSTLLTTCSDSGDYKYTVSKFYQLYYVIQHCNIKYFEPDFEDEFDRQLVNTIFTKLIMCIWSNIESLYCYNKLYTYSEFMHRFNKLYDLVKHFMTIQVTPDFKQELLHVKVTINNKNRYYIYSNMKTKFKQIDAKEYEEYCNQFYNDGVLVRFLNLTEMEQTK